MRTIRLDDRLRAAADFVRPGAVLADIGTDHGYLPAYLLQQGKLSRAIAADINEGPLASARETAEECGLQDQIELILSDGLERVPVEEVTDVVIAGMGGDLIGEIIAASPALKDPDKRLILQPMTNPGGLRRYLYENGFAILAEKAAIDRQHAYCILLVQYTGRRHPVTELFQLVGQMPNNQDEASREYLKRQADKLKKIATGQRRSKTGTGRAEELEALAESIRGLLSPERKEDD